MQRLVRLPCRLYQPKPAHWPYLSPLGPLRIFREDRVREAVLRDQVEAVDVVDARNTRRTL